MNKMSQVYLPLLGSTVLLALVGCATAPTYQPAAQTRPTVVVDARGVPNYYQVKRGDTVSQIAQRYGLNYRQIGAINGLDSQYTIYSGQWLQLWARQATANSSQARPPARAQDERYRDYRQPTAAPTSPPAKTVNTSANQTPSRQPTANDTIGYQYPSNNQVIRQFDSNSNTIGMWFAGHQGDPVLVSQSGTVLYAGNGLPEYGNLIMVRHNDGYVTAYAHNDQLLVKEGDNVQKGQRIATMGSTGNTNQVALEFQVRQNGNPIDPRAVLGR